MQEAAKQALTFFNDINTGSANTAAGLADRQNAFIAYARAALAASQNLDQGTQDATKSNLEATAVTLGLADKLQQLENQADKTGTALHDMGNRGSGSAPAALQDVASSAGDAAGSLGDVSNEAEEAQDATTGFGARGTEALQILTQALVDARAQFSAISDAAAKAFDSHLMTDFFDTFDSTSAGFSRVIDAMNSATAEVNAQIANQRTQLQNEIADINNLGTASNQGFGSFGTNADAAAAKMKNLADLIDQGKINMGLLNQQDFQPLEQALQAASDRAAQLAANLKQAGDTFAQTLADLQDAVDEAAGNEEAIEERRHEQALANLKAEAQAAGQLNSQKYQQAVQLENQLHALKEKNINSENNASNGSSGSGSSSASSGNASPVSSGLAPTQQGGITLNVHFQPGTTIIGNDLQKAGEQLAAPVLKQLQAIQARSRVNIITNKAA